MNQLNSQELFVLKSLTESNLKLVNQWGTHSAFGSKKPQPPKYKHRWINSSFLSYVKLILNTRTLVQDCYITPKRVHNYNNHAKAIFKRKTGSGVEVYEQTPATDFIIAYEQMIITYKVLLLVLQLDFLAFQIQIPGGLADSQTISWQHHISSMHMHKLSCSSLTNALLRVHLLLGIQHKTSTCVASTNCDLIRRLRVARPLTLSNKIFKSMLTS